MVSLLLLSVVCSEAALMKEAYTIYMSVKKLSFYLIQADVLLESDHLPLKRFLHKNKLNSKVNNWVMELESFNIEFEHIKGQNDVLADTLSCLTLTLTPAIETLKHKLQHNKLDKEYYSIDDHGLLMRKVVDGGPEFCTIYLPTVLVLQELRAAHDELGHNGFPRTYAALKRVFSWKGMKENIKTTVKCVPPVHYTDLKTSNSRGRFSVLHCYQLISSVWIFL